MTEKEIGGLCAEHGAIAHCGTVRKATDVWQWVVKFSDGHVQAWAMPDQTDAVQADKQAAPVWEDHNVHRNGLAPGPQ